MRKGGGNWAKCNEHFFVEGAPIYKQEEIKRIMIHSFVYNINRFL